MLSHLLDSSGKKLIQTHNEKHVYSKSRFQCNKQLIWKKNHIFYENMYTQGKYYHLNQQKISYENNVLNLITFFFC